MRTLKLGWLALAGVVSGWGCGDDDGRPPPPPDAGLDADTAVPGDVGPEDVGPEPDAGPSCTTFTWDPDIGDLARWPEPALVVPDPSTRTGFRLQVDASRYEPILRRAGGVASVFTSALPQLDGFGVNAEAYFRFARGFDPERLPGPDDALAVDSGVGMVVLGPGEPRHVGVILRAVDDGTLLLAPVRPLPAKARVAAYVTRALMPASGGCLEPGDALAALLADPSGDVADALEAMEALGAIDAPADVVALTVFPTQSITEESVAVADDIASRSFALDDEGRPECVTEAQWIRCDGTFAGLDYREPDGVVRVAPGEPAEPRAMWRVPFTVWLPLEGERPFPTLLFGHGLGSGQEQGQDLAEYAAARGFATIGVPALMHGAHPSRPDPMGDSFNAVLGFFTIGDADHLVDALRLRDHWRQSTFDKLQLTRILEAGMDVDGDGAVDLDGARMAYVGASLGGIMGPELLALTDAYSAGVLIVPGSRVASIVSDSALIGGGLRLLAPRGTTEGDIMRFIPVLQTAIDRGDSASWGPHILADRVVGEAGAPPPSVLAAIALDDQVVPPVCNYTLVRAAGLPLVPPEVLHEPGIALTGPAPIAGNVADGAATAGFLQFDVIREGAVIELAEHDNVPRSEQGIAAFFEFLDSHFVEGLARIIDPYETTMLEHGTPPTMP
ncbi:MAG: hypothetical protein IT379_18425 [Deltaproteobacteria bacterium]|nr:hypothetical protein [Deltaproteobacteria bacterium]